VNGDVEHLDKVQLPRIEFSTTLVGMYNSIKEEALKKGYLKP
jgi:hypothetical protein